MDASTDVSAGASMGTATGTSMGIVASWNQVALHAIRVAKPAPPMVARSLAVLHTAMYDAWAACDSFAVSTQLGGSLRRPSHERTAHSKSRAMSLAAYIALLDQFPAQKGLFEAQMAALGLNPGLRSTDTSTPEGIGTVSANACVQYCHGDGANQLGSMTASGMAYADYTGYVGKNPAAVVSQPTSLVDIPAPGNWQPLTYTDKNGVVLTPRYLAPHWSQVRPFAMTSPSQFRPSPPAAPGSAEYAAQAQRVIDVQTALTEEQKVIAEYWADGPATETPPGHWCLLAQFISARDSHNDDADVKMFFALTNALFDAGIAAWDAKRAYDSVRPITAIRYLMHGKQIMGYGPQGPAGGLQLIPGESWIPFQSTTFPTPPFPEHVSGHSTFSSAAAEALKRFTGTDRFGARYSMPAEYLLFDQSLPARDTTLHWETLSQAAEEAGMSRIYGGIHFDNGNESGLAMGRQVGAGAFLKAQAYWSGAD